MFFGKKDDFTSLILILLLCGGKSCDNSLFFIILLLCMTGEDKGCGKDRPKCCSCPPKRCECKCFEPKWEKCYPKCDLKWEKCCD